MLETVFLLQYSWLSMVQGLISKFQSGSLVSSYLSQVIHHRPHCSCFSPLDWSAGGFPLMCPVLKTMCSQNLQTLETSSTQTRSVQITVPLPAHTPLKLEERNHQSPNTTTVKARETICWFYKHRSVRAPRVCTREDPGFEQEWNVPIGAIIFSVYKARYLELMVPRGVSASEISPCIHLHSPQATSSEINFLVQKW